MRLACPLVSAAGEPSNEQTDIEILYAKVTRIEKLRRSSSTIFSVGSQPACPTMRTFAERLAQFSTGTGEIWRLLLQPR
jgi:hypothetical protein